MEEIQSDSIKPAATMVMTVDSDVGPEEFTVIKGSKEATKELIADLLRTSDDCCVSLGALRQRVETQPTKRPIQRPPQRDLKEIETELNDWQTKISSLFFLRDRLSAPINKIAAEKIAEIERWRDEQLAKVTGLFESEIIKGSQTVQNLKRDQFLLVTEILAEPEKLALDGCEKITTRELNRMNVEQIEALVWKRSGKKELFRYYKTPTGVKPKQRSLQERRKAGIQYLKYNSCRFCHDISHQLAECPTLKAIQCATCGQHGHTTKRCQEGSEKDLTTRPNRRKQSAK
jgi:hypothetical protein